MSLVVTTQQYLLLHPFEYIYFNEAIGFLPGAYRNFETDYWGKSYKESADFIKNQQNVLPTTTVALCGNKEAEIYFKDSSFRTIWVPGCRDINDLNWDYAIAMGRNNEWLTIDAETVFAVSRSNVPLSKVFQRRADVSKENKL
jgi:hypothetical protein